MDRSTKSTVGNNSQGNPDPNNSDGWGSGLWNLGNSALQRATDFRAALGSSLFNYDVESEEKTCEAKRAESFSDQIDKLKDNRGLFAKVFLATNVDPETLSKHFDEVKKRFRQFEEVGIMIPEYLETVGCITEEQAEELKTLAAEGAKRLYEKYGSLGSFGLLNIVSKVNEQSDLETIKNLLSTCTNFRKLAKNKDRVVLNAIDFSDPNTRNEKLEFAQENDYKLGIYLENDNDIDSMIVFLENPEKKPWLQNLEAIHLLDITENNSAKVNLLLCLMKNHCSSLKEFFCRDIKPIWYIPDCSLKKLSCGVVYGYLSFYRCKIENFSFIGMERGGSIDFGWSGNNTMTSLSCNGEISSDAIFNCGKLQNIQHIDFVDDNIKNSEILKVFQGLREEIKKRQALEEQ